MEIDQLDKAFDPTLSKYSTYEEYLEWFITGQERYYLSDEDLARQLIELGYFGKANIKLENNSFWWNTKSRSQERQNGESFESVGICREEFGRVSVF